MKKTLIRLAVICAISVVAFTIKSSVVNVNSDENSSSKNANQEINSNEKECLNVLAKGTEAKKVKDIVEKEYKFSNMESINKLSANLANASISIVPSSNKEFKVSAKYKIEAYNKAQIESIKNNIDLKNVTENTISTLEVVSKDSNEDIWKWIEKKEPKASLGVELIIYVPNNFNAYDVQNDVGEINISNLSGNVQVKSDAGSINVEDFKFTGKCYLETDSGEINFEINESEKDSELKCETEAGSITGNIKKGSTALVKVDLFTEVGSIELNFNKNEVKYNKKNSSNVKCLVNGECELSARTEVGSIDINN